MSAQEEGVPPGDSVLIVDYDPRWPALFEEERRRILGVLGEDRPRIEHVGSTAVPGLAAKPVIDLLVGAPRPPTEGQRRRLAELEYVSMGELGIPGREFFRKGAPRTHHLHWTAFGGSFWASHVAFRDALRRDPALAREYERLKRALAGRFPNDREAYTEGKTPFIERVLGGR